MEELDLKELFNTFWRQKLIVIIIVAVFSLIGIIYTSFMVTPKFESYTTLVLKQIVDTEVDEDKFSTEQRKEGIRQSDLSINSGLVSTYSELIKSKTVIREVLNNLSINDVSEGVLRKNISVSEVQDTELIQITVKNENSEYAAMIANEIAKVFSKKVVEIYNISNIYVVDEAEVSNAPNNINHTKDIGIFVLIGMVASVIYILIYNVFDSTIKTEKDIEDVTGLIVLASIVDFDMDSTKGGR